MKRRNGIVIGLIAACIISVASCSASALTSTQPSVYTVSIGFDVKPAAGEITTGRARSLVGGVVGLISVIVGGLALARAAGRLGIVALMLGLIAMILSVIHLATFTGGFGTGSGRAGAIVALVLGLIGTSLGGLARFRRHRNTV